LTVVNGNVGIGSTNPENSEGWNRVLDLLGGPNAKLSVRTNAIDARVMAHEGGWWGAPAGMIIGTKSDHSLSFATSSASRLTILGNGYVGIGTMTPAHRLDVRANRIKLGLEEHGGGQLIIANNPGDNKIYLEAFSSDGNGSAAELLLTGRSVDPVPQITLVAVNTTVTGALRVNGKLSVGGGKAGYVVDQFINKLGETLEEGDVVVIGENQSTLYYGQHENIPIPEVDLAQSAYHTGVCGIVCETHGELRPQTEGADDGKAKGGKKTRKPTLTPHEFTSEEMEKKERTEVQPEQIGLMVTLGAFAHCKVDADIASIKVGDLLTTSPTRGHAQKALDPAKAVGAIIGKALGSLKEGKGKIPVLVMLQ
jgi:hypothetical protein